MSRADWGADEELSAEEPKNRSLPGESIKLNTEKQKSRFKFFKKTRRRVSIDSVKQVPLSLIFQDVGKEPECPMTSPGSGPTASK